MTNNTATRWWVRLGARWLARIDGVSGQLRLAMLVMTGLSTATLTLRQYGHGEYAWPLIAVTGVVMLAFTYGYTEGGVWNTMARDRNVLSNNFPNPNSRISNELLLRGLAAHLKGRELNENEREVIQNELDQGMEDLWDGVELPEERER